ncbi:hypothetical protein R1sor_014516 [Riccia sorocarpa]|uniref:Uncharacterized protein n=1 Tax=Riccia sorocarpa TaxID=122646 RepID=A0ABD3HC62_9MARC
MTWHKEHRSDDGVMRLVVDSPAVHHVEQTWLEFGRDSRHLWFGLASNVVAPYGVKSPSHSTWPDLLIQHLLDIAHQDECYKVIDQTNFRRLRWQTSKTSM